MAFKVREEKVKKVEEYRKLMENARAVYLLDFTGLTVAEFNELRKRLKSKGYKVKVVKNTLLKRAIDGSVYNGLSEFLRGPNALLISYDKDVIGILKLFYEFRKEVEKGVLKGGWVEGEIVKREEIRTLATLPSYDELMGKVVVLINAPINNLYMVLCGLLKKLAVVINEIKKKKEES